MSTELKASHPEVPWKEIAGIRVILAHGYFHIEDDIIGNAVVGDVPHLREHLTEILATLPASEP